MDTKSQENKGIGEQLKGKVQKGAGKLTGDDDLRRRGEGNEAIGEGREKVARGVKDAKDKIKEGIGGARENS